MACLLRITLLPESDSRSSQGVELDSLPLKCLASQSTLESGFFIPLGSSPVVSLPQFVPQGYLPGLRYWLLHRLLDPNLVVPYGLASFWFVEQPYPRLLSLGCRLTAAPTILLYPGLPA